MDLFENKFFLSIFSHFFLFSVFFSYYYSLKYIYWAELNKLVLIPKKKVCGRFSNHKALFCLFFSS